MAEVDQNAVGDPRRSYTLSRWIFLRLLGVVYLIAFWSLGIQIIGLVGEHGILPVQGYLDGIHQTYGTAAYHLAPTLCWFSASDTTLRLLSIGGAVVAGLLIMDVAPVAMLLLLWVLYLSLAVAGQVFLNFQWDALLLETGLLAVFYAPWSLRPRLRLSRQPPVAARWLLWLSLLKLMVLSGGTKLLSGDPTWRDLTAITFHYQTQPLPTWLSWYAHNLPSWFNKFSAVPMYLIEIVAPLAIFAPRRFRWVRLTGCGLMVLLQTLIAATGNYGFFNLLSIVLCLTMLDDGVWRRIWPARFTPPLTAPTERRAWCRTGLGATCVLIPLSLLACVREIVYTLPGGPHEMPALTDRLAEWIEPLRSVNGYGLFRVMTTERPELVIEGSRDSQTWVKYRFRYKPGEVDRRPAFCAPYMPRLDWQMWFAALNPSGNQQWLLSLVGHLLRGTPEVEALLAENPFAGRPPRFVRIVMYDYQFTRPGEAGGNWWVRRRIGELTGPLSLPEQDRD